MNTIDLIKIIERRPGMYVDIDSIESLFSFIQGFYFSRSQSGLLEKEDLSFSEKFYPWLKQKYSMEGVSTWAVLVEKLACIKSEKSLNVFFREFNDFLRYLDDTEGNRDE